MKTEEFATEGARCENGTNTITSKTSEDAWAEQVIRGKSAFNVPIIDKYEYCRTHRHAIELFGAFSISRDFESSDYFIYHWFYKDREEPIGPYEQLIMDYDPRIDPHEGLCGGMPMPGDNDEMEAEFAIRSQIDFLNECFTLDEINLFGDYLRHYHNLDLHYYPIELPLVGARRFNPFFKMTWSELGIHLDMTDFSHHNLSFKVQACQWSYISNKSDSEVIAFFRKKFGAI